MVRTKRGFTLVEILSCIMIVVALAAIAASVYSKAKEGGKRSDEISKLHQIGLAANLYREQNDNWPGNTSDLVVTGLVTKEICFSNRDKHKSGWANWFLDDMSKRRPAYRAFKASFPNSFLCYTDVFLFRREEAYRLVNEQSGGGLFVSLLDSVNKWPNETADGPYFGRYYRVLLDGSVQVKQHRMLYGKDSHGVDQKIFSLDIWFFDPSEKWVSDIFSTY